jgi:hypothetical protein
VLQQLDIAIALVVVLLGVSLCVTILVQMVSALFNLRGTHLRSGLATLLATVDPELRTHAHAIGDARRRHARSAGRRFDGRREATRAATPDRKTRAPLRPEGARVFRSDVTALVGVLRTPTRRTAHLRFSAPPCFAVISVLSVGSPSVDMRRSYRRYNFAS